MRETSTVRDVLAGCFVCWGEQYHWHGPNAQGLAAQHHDRTGHPTWVEVNMMVYYGEPPFAKQKQAQSEGKPGLWEDKYG
jgi:hypothetical protein